MAFIIFCLHSYLPSWIPQRKANFRFHCELCILLPAKLAKGWVELVPQQHPLFRNSRLDISMHWFILEKAE